MILSPYTIDGVRNPEPDFAWSLATTLVEGLPNQANGRPLKVRRSMYPVDGTSQDWLYHELGTLAYILEGTHDSPLDPGVKQRSIDGMRPVFTRLLDHALEGPSVRGRVRSEDGTPLRAQVRIEEQRTHEGEVWTTNAATGRFGRLFAEPGTWTLRITAPGHVGQSVPVAVGHDPSVVDVVLRRVGQ